MRNAPPVPWHGWGDLFAHRDPRHYTGKPTVPADILIPIASSPARRSAILTEVVLNARLLLTLFGRQ